MGFLVCLTALAADRSLFLVEKDGGTRVILGASQTVERFMVRSLLSLLATVTEQRPCSRIIRAAIDLSKVGTPCSSTTQ